MRSRLGPRNFEVRPVSPPIASLTAAESANLSLLLDRRTPTTSPFADSLDAHTESSVEHCDEVDQLFALLDGGRVVVSVDRW